MRSLVALLLFLTLLPGSVIAAPSWGAAKSSLAGTPPADLKPGEWVWGGDAKDMGPMAVVVSLTEQRAYTYRNGVLIAVSTVSTGKPGHETPTGVFTILQKDREHHSSKYNNAPMPYQERLTWDGVALHAGGLPGYPESHGCVHLPTEFARLLFDATNMGMVVVIAKEGLSPEDLVHPSVASPIDPRTGVEDAAPLLGTQDQFRWEPQKSPSGALSMVMSTTDRRLFVFRNGIEIGRARIDFRDGPARSGTHAYLLSAALAGQGPAWRQIGIPGREDEAGQNVSAHDVARVVVPPEFSAVVTPLLQPGVVLLQTDLHVLPETTGPALQVLNADVPTL
ncbi:MAG: L,D-transpeptidase [Stenotrophomonas sp.]